MTCTTFDRPLTFKETIKPSNRVCRTNHPTNHPKGVVPYYYAAAALTGSLPDGPAVEVDRCVYNNMVDKGVVGPSPFVGAEQCRHTPLQEIKNVHFTLCQKPWVSISVFLRWGVVVAVAAAASTVDTTQAS
jgi:hypothetical protein